MFLRTAAHSVLGNIQQDKTKDEDIPPSPDLKIKAASAFARRPLAVSSFGDLSRVKVCASKLIQRKKKSWTEREENEEEADKKSTTNSSNQDDTHSNIDYLDDDFNFESDDDDPYEPSPAPKNYEDNDVSTQAYMSACKVLKVVPAMFIARNLTGDEIIMKHHPLGPVGIKACAIALVKNATVKKLDVKGAEMGPQGAHYIADMLRENIFLTDLMLADNHIGRAGLEAIAEVLESHSTIRRLDLSGNGFEEQDAIYFVRILENNTHLRQLMISHNNFREKGGITLSTAIASNDTLVHLDLSWNHLRWKGAVAICQGLKANNGLTSVNLSWNGFSIQGCTAMSDTLKHNDTLLDLDLACNRIDRVCLQELLVGVKANQTLTKLKLCYNPITSDGALDILTMLEQGKAAENLKEISISTQAVREEFTEKLEKLQKERRTLSVKHGVILHNYLTTSYKEINNLFGDPMIILMECMRIRNLRLVDLFASLDEDGSGALTREEFSKGLEAVNLPLSREMIEELIDRLDSDGDGEVDFAELVSGQKEHKKKMYRIMQKNKNVPPEENTILQLSNRLKEMMDERFMSWEKKKKFSKVVKRATLFQKAKQLTEETKKVAWEEQSGSKTDNPTGFQNLDENENPVDHEGLDEEDHREIQRSKSMRILLRKGSRATLDAAIQGLGSMGLNMQPTITE